IGGIDPPGGRAIREKGINMGISPCRRGPVRLAVYMLAVQASIIAPTDTTGHPVESARAPGGGEVARAVGGPPARAGGPPTALPIAHRHGLGYGGFGHGQAPARAPGTAGTGEERSVAQRAESVLENAARRARAAEPRGTRSARKTRRARANTRLAHAQAMLRLKRAGLRRTSSGRCANRWIRTCASLENVREGSVRKVIRLKRRSGCPVTITGGTEVGHAP